MTKSIQAPAARPSLPSTADLYRPCPIEEILRILDGQLPGKIASALIENDVADTMAASIEELSI